MAVFNPFDFFLEPEGENFPFDYDAALDHELAPFLKCAELTPKFADYFTQIESELLAMKPWPPRTTAVQEGLAALVEIFTFRSTPRRALCASSSAVVTAEVAIGVAPLGVSTHQASAVRRIVVVMSGLLSTGR